MTTTKTNTLSPIDMLTLELGITEEEMETKFEQCLARAMRVIRQANRYAPGCIFGDGLRDVLVELFAPGSILSAWEITIDHVKCFVEDEDMLLGRSYLDENGESQPGTCGITHKSWRDDLLSPVRR